ncbi:uncharacterized protein LOC123532405 [Mercenaria mercenaria]|uniref:uncharacterized protein LOC123532405 n=1 Tax=Mercenaria mercenaria TaxID=6596 RepID=UPI00234F6EE2|nr:uncharacterized protein LOC123532405 [Mercenaria mercenaria]
MVIANMDTSTPIEDSFLETFEVSSSTASAIQMAWHIRASNIPFVEGFRVHYQKVASTYIQYGPKLHPTDNEYEIGNLVADTYYKVCLVVYRNDSIPFRECTDASTTNWQVPVSIGSSIGAVLALSMIVFIVLLSRCQLPLKYRRKKSKRSQKYDTISSNYHDDQYEFSETVTHGPDDDYTSEYDHEEESYYELSPTEPRRPKQFLPEKPNIPNGLGRSHVHPHQFAHHQSQHRNSLGRIQYPPSHHHGRQFRAYSIQADGNVCFFNQPCSPLAKDPRKNSLGKESRQSDDLYHDCSHVPAARKTSMKEFSPTKFELSSAHKLCSSAAQAFTFIDEIPEHVSKSSLNRSNESTEILSNSNSKEPANLLITDIDFDDLSRYGAAGGSSPPDKSNKTIEMSASHRMLAVPESVSFDEHSV